MRNILLIACLVLTGYLQTHRLEQTKNDASSINFQVTVQESKTLERRLELSKKLPSFGFGNIVADRCFLEFLQYFSDVSDENNDRSTEENISWAFFETILEKDPFYRDYYLFLSTSTTLYAAQPERTVELMETGLENIDPQALSDSFYIWRYKGVDELLFLGDSEAAQQSFENAALWANYSDAPESEILSRDSARTASFLASDPDSTAAQVAAWGSILASALNDDIRDRAVQQLERLGKTVSFQDDGTFQISNREVDAG